MCGFIYRKSTAPKGQSGFLKHRGPDQQSYFLGDNFELEFSRLTVTGTVDGEVPVFSKNGDWLVAFNGEIYNFKSLIDDFSLSHSNSDTKVIANGLEKLGLDFLKLLRGMYAGIAINTLSKKTYLFRDPLGEKPLFFAKEAGDLILASEFTALLKHLGRPLSLNPLAISDYFRFGYVEEPNTFDRDIYSVKRGVVMEVGQDSSLSQVMDLVGFNESETAITLPELLQTLNSEVSFSTVPTGLALSAGIDSTSILYAMSKYRSDNFVPLIMNISPYGLSEEASQALNSCKLLGIDAHIIQSSGETRLLEDLQSLARRNDQPHADPSGLSYLTIFQSAKELGLKVVLLGHGPDELFWGYPWFNSELIQTQKVMFPKHLGPREYWNTPAKNPRLLFYSGLQEDKSNSDFSGDPFLRSKNPWEKYRAEMVHSYLSTNGLRQSDRLAMSCGIEPRTPYSDSRLYGWAQQNSIQSADAFDKFEFRNAVELGPLEHTRFRKKQGFESPMGGWFERPEVQDYSGDCLQVLLKADLDWRLKPKLAWLSPSEKYRIMMLGGWLFHFQ
jgi:asparagine synthase (glutamine-hydrolysing)